MPESSLGKHEHSSAVPRGVISVAKIKVLVAQAQAIYREGICSMLSCRDDIEVVGEAANGKEAVEKTLQLAPDVALMNSTLPLVDGVEAARRIIGANSGVKVVLLLPAGERVRLFKAVKSGTTGYVPTDAEPEELVRAIKTAHDGKVYFHAEIARVFLDDYIRLTDRQESSDPYNLLTVREREILQLVAEGQTSGQIGDTLGLAKRTVLGHKSRLMKKLGIHNGTELVKYAFRRGIIGEE